MSWKLLTDEIMFAMRPEGKYTFWIETRPGFEKPCTFGLDYGDIDDSEIREQIESQFANTGNLIRIERNGATVWPQSRTQKTLHFKHGDANHTIDDAW